jgi:hypothetical protein
MAKRTLDRRVSLEEARRSNRMREFIKTHDVKPDPEVQDPKARFERLLEAMARSSSTDDQT